MDSMMVSIIETRIDELKRSRFSSAHSALPGAAAHVLDAPAPEGCSPLMAACASQHQAPVPAVHVYDVLCVGGLQQYAAEALQETANRCTIVAQIGPVSWGDAQVPQGDRQSGVGKAGLSRVRISSGDPLPTEMLNSPCGYCTLVHVCEGTLVPGEDTMGLVAAAVVHTDRWHQILHTLRSHAQRPLQPTFRTTTVRGGEHEFGSQELTVVVADAVHNETGWTVDLKRPEIDLVTFVVGSQYACGILVQQNDQPDLKDRVLPRETRPWLAQSTRCSMRPSRAHLILRIARLPEYAGACRLLDPCGGLGTIALEAAAMARVDALTLDSDPEAVREAASNVQRAEGMLKGTVQCRLGSAYDTGLPDSSIDLVVTDPPWGCKHKKLDTGRVLRELARVVVPLGMVLMCVGDWGGGVRKAERAIKKNPFRGTDGAWLIREQVVHNAGGLECVVFVIQLKEIDQPSVPKLTRVERRAARQALAENVTTIAQ